MRSYFRTKLSRRDGSLCSFTLIELLVVMAIIAILAALILYAGNSVIIKGQRSRASAEISAMSTALESYKTDNGIYPTYSSASFIPANYVSQDPSAKGSSALYVVSSETIFYALTGQTNLLDTPVAGNKSYMTFKGNQVGNASATAGTPGDGTTTYVKDPFNMSYGYSTGIIVGTTTNAPNNGWGFFDLWSAGGVSQAKYTANNALTNDWLANWNQ